MSQINKLYTRDPVKLAKVLKGFGYRSTGAGAALYQNTDCKVQIYDTGTVQIAFEEAGGADRKYNPSTSGEFDALLRPVPATVRELMVALVDLGVIEHRSLAKGGSAVGSASTPVASPATCGSAPRTSATAGDMPKSTVVQALVGRATAEFLRLDSREPDVATLVGAVSSSPAWCTGTDEWGAGEPDRKLASCTIVLEPGKFAILCAALSGYGGLCDVKNCGQNGKSIISAITTSPHIAGYRFAAFDDTLVYAHALKLHAMYAGKVVHQYRPKLLCNLLSLKVALGCITSKPADIVCFIDNFLGVSRERLSVWTKAAGSIFAGAVGIDDGCIEDGGTRIHFVLHSNSGNKTPSPTMLPGYFLEVKYASSIPSPEFYRNLDPKVMAVSVIAFLKKNSVTDINDALKYFHKPEFSYIDACFDPSGKLLDIPIPVFRTPPIALNAVIRTPAVTVAGFRISGDNIVI